MNRKQRLTRLKSNLDKSFKTPAIIAVNIQGHNPGNVKNINTPKSIINKAFNVEHLNLQGSLDLIQLENKASTLRTLDKNVLGVVLVETQFKDSGKFLSGTELKDLLKEVNPSPNPKIEDAELSTARIMSLICVLSWIEVELISDTANS